METEIIKWEGFVLKKIKEDNVSTHVEDNILAFLDSIDIEGKSVIDGGSSIGIYALVFSYSVGSGGRVYCYEMQGVIYDLCKENVELNKRKNIACFNLALTDKTGDNIGYTAIDYSGKNVSSMGIRVEPDNEHKVQTVAIDDLFIHDVGLIKLDIEGSEPKALEGAWKTIDRDKPYMIIELSPVYLVGKEQETIDKIISHGYTVEAIGDCNYICKPIKK